MLFLLLLFFRICFFRSIFLPKFFFLRLIYICEELFHRFCMNQILPKNFIHKKHGQSSKYFQMNIILRIWSCDQKNQIHRKSVQRIIIHTVFYNHCSKSCFLYYRCFRMWNRNSFPDSCCSFFFPLLYTGFVHFFI